MDISWVVFISVTGGILLIFFYSKKDNDKQGKQILGDDEMLFDSETGTKFSLEDVKVDNVVIHSDINRIKTDEEIETNYHSAEIGTEKAKNYLRKKGYRSFNLEEEEDPEFLNELSLFDEYTQLYLDVAFRLSDQSLVTFIQVTYEINSGEGMGIYTETQLLLWYKSFNVNGHLTTSEELFIEDLKSNRQLSFIKRSNNYFFKTNRPACTDDVNLLLGTL